MSTCYTNCEVVLITNTGNTDTSVSFVDCSGSTINLYLEPNQSFYINFCNNFPFFGDNIDFQVQGSSIEIYVFSSCCEKSDVFYTFLNGDIEQPINIDNVIYTELVVPSDETLETKFGCYELVNIVPDISQLSGFSEPYYSVVKNYDLFDQGAACDFCKLVNPCPKDCYTLYSCDGRFSNIKSSLASLSAYTDGFVSLDVLTPNVSGNNICFYVTYLGFVSCVDDYDLQISQEPECDCSCLCYQFNTLNNNLETTYVDCNNQLNVVVFESNNNVRICSKIKPNFNTELPIGYKLGGYCFNNNCPEIVIPNIQPVNECDVLTLFPLYVECVNELPTNKMTFDGAVSLIITGGTPPYTVYWDNGSVSQSLDNLTFGSYTATVVDYYGDFTATTTCVLSSTTTTTTTTILPPTPNIVEYLCLYVDTANQFLQDRFINFTFAGFYNNKPYWQSNPPDNLQIVWNSIANMWLISGATLGQIINMNPSNPPLTGWEVIGFQPPFNINGVYMYTGTCNNVPLINLEILKTDPTCDCNGSIVLTPSLGYPPYQYSVNGGNTYSLVPIFNNLCSGLYPVEVLDSSGFTSTSQIVLADGPEITTYKISLLIDTQAQTFEITVFPNLPNGANITFDLVHNRLFSRGPNVASAVYNNSLSVLVNPPSPIVGFDSSYFINSQSPLPYPCESSNKFLTDTYYTWNLTFNNSTIIEGSYTNLVSFTSSSPCNYARGEFGIYIDSAKINGCDCCELVVINPKFRISSLGDIIFQ